MLEQRRAGGSGPGEVLEFSGDGRQLLGLTPDGTLHLWQSATGRPATRLLPARRRRLTLAPLVPVLLSRARAVRLDARAVHLPAGTHAAGLGFAGGTPLALVAGGGKAAVLNVATGEIGPAARAARHGGGGGVQRCGRPGADAGRRRWRDRRVGRAQRAAAREASRRRRSCAQRRRPLCRDRMLRRRRSLVGRPAPTACRPGQRCATRRLQSQQPAAAGRRVRRLCEPLSIEQWNGGGEAAGLRDAQSVSARLRDHRLLASLRCCRRVRRPRSRRSCQFRRRRARVGARDDQGGRRGRCGLCERARLRTRRPARGDDLER